MLLKLSALVVVASASVFCLAAPPVGGSGLAARDSYAAVEDAKGIASTLNNGPPDEAVGLANRATEICGCPPGKVGFFIHGHCACSGDLLEPAYGSGQDAVPNVEDSTVSDADLASTENNDHELDARGLMCVNNCGHGLRAARGPDGICHCETVDTGGEKPLLDSNAPESVNKARSPSHEARVPKEHPQEHECSTLRCSEGYHGESDTKSGQCTCVQDWLEKRGARKTAACDAQLHCDENHLPRERFDDQGKSLGWCQCVKKIFTGARTGAPPPYTGPHRKRQNGLEKRENRDYIVVDQDVTRGPGHSDIYSQRTAACDAILTCDENHRPEERFDAQGTSLKECWCAIKTATGARTGAPPPSTGPGRRRQDVNGLKERVDTQTLPLDAQVQDGLHKRGLYSWPSDRCDAEVKLVCKPGQHREERLNLLRQYIGLCWCVDNSKDPRPHLKRQDGDECPNIHCASGWVPKSDGSGQCTCVQDGLHKRVPPNIVFDPNVHTGPAQSGLKSMPTARCNAKLACGKDRTPMEHFYISGQPTGLCWCQPKVKKRQDYNECPNIRCASGWVPVFDGSGCYCALDSNSPYSQGSASQGPDGDWTSGDEEYPSSSFIAPEGDASEMN